jgi:hypothetical protein
MTYFFIFLACLAFAYLAWKDMEKAALVSTVRYRLFLRLCISLV